MNNEKKCLARVAEIIDNTTIVINKGSNNGIKKGDAFLIYSVGKEIIDPETSKSLGNLEIVKGQAIVLHVQEEMATLKSSKTKLPNKKIVYRKPNNNLGLASLVSFFESETKEEIYGNEEILPFNNVTIGDFAKLI